MSEARPQRQTHLRATLLLSCLAQFMVILDVSVVNAYTVTFAGFLLLGGRAADLLGRRRVFVAGLTLFSVASLAGGLANSQEMLIVARGLLYGVGVAVGHRDASDLGAVLVTLALSFAAQNTVTALRMNAAAPLPAGQPAGSQPAELAASRSTVIPSRLAAHDRLHTRRHERIQARRQERGERRETWR